MIEELVQQFEKEFETEPADETETVKDESPNESIESPNESIAESPKSLIATMIERLEEEFMTVESPDDEEESEQEPAESDSDDEQGGQDESEPTDEEESESSEPSEDVEQDETENESENESESDQLTELMNELQTKSKALDDERVKLLERVEEAEKKAEQSEKQMKRLVLSHALANRDDIVDGRLIAELVDVDSLEVEEGMTIEETVTNRINEVVQKYGNVLAKEKGEKYVARDIGGLTTYEKIRPIGRATAKAQDEPFSSKQQLLEEARQRAEKGGQKERVNYLALKRKYGLE